MKIKAVLFDMDGVLIDAKEWHYEALNRALGLFGYDISRHEHITTYDGLPTKRKLEKLTADKGLPNSLHDFISEIKQQFTVSLVHELCRPNFKHEYALSRLRKEGYKLAVASNSIRQTIELMMNNARLEQYLHLFLSNQDVVKCKPDPEMYVLAMHRLKVLPSEALIVEDNEHGIQAAIASGAHLMTVGSVHEVTYERIKERINQIELGG